MRVVKIFIINIIKVLWMISIIQCPVDGGKPIEVSMNTGGEWLIIPIHH